MIQTVSKLSHFNYTKVIKPILFVQKPDSVHNHLLKISQKFQSRPLFQKIISNTLAFQNEPLLSQTIAGVKFRNPIGLSAGFDKNFELVPLMRSIGFGFMEGGSVTFHSCKGNPRPWFYRLPKTKSLVVNAGLANEGVRPIVDRLRLYPKSITNNFPLNISVAKTNSKKAASEDEAIADYVGSLKHIKSHNIGAMITINISCPNTYGGEPFTTPKKLDRLLSAVDLLKISKPLFIKMPCDLGWDRFNELLIVADKHNIKGVTISNLTKNRKNTRIKDSLPENIKGNLSGKPTFELSNNLIKKTYATYGNRFIIIGVGGVFSAEDAYTKIKSGASLVELITGMIFEGPQLIGQINKGIAELIKKDGFKNISEAIGADT